MHRAILKIPGAYTVYLSVEGLNFILFHFKYSHHTSLTLFVVQIHSKYSSFNRAKKVKSFCLNMIPTEDKDKQKLIITNSKMFLIRYFFTPYSYVIFSVSIDSSIDHVICGEENKLSHLFCNFPTSFQEVCIFRDNQFIVWCYRQLNRYRRPTTIQIVGSNPRSTLFELKVV